MKFYWIKTRWFIKKLFPGFVWDIPGNEKKVYLTFDDGPTPGITEWVLDILGHHGIKATFFCIGNNIKKHPDIFKRVIEEGHAIGNHTFNHVNGWKVKTEYYIENTEACSTAIKELHPVDVKLFRPPYGKMSPSQAESLRRKGYKLIMWDVLSADFDRAITPEKCLQNVIRNTVSGSIIIFHDSIKASQNLEYALPRAIEYLKKNDFSFGKLG